MEKTAKRTRWLLLVAGLSMTGAIAWYLIDSHDPDAPSSSWFVLQLAAVSDAQCEIIMGENVWVSTQQTPNAFWECVSAADPLDPDKLYAAVIHRRNPECDIVVFDSSDGGASWEIGATLHCPNERQFFDPALAAAPNGIAYLVYMDTSIKAAQSDSRIVFLATDDGGRNWREENAFDQFVDRPWLAVDNRSEQRPRAVYCLGQIELLTPAGEIDHAEPIFLRSNDGFLSLSDPVYPHVGREMFNCGPGNPVILSDGSVLVAYGDRYLKRKIRKWPRPALYTAISTDGGKSFATATQVNTKWWHDNLQSNPSSVVGKGSHQLAVDASSKEPDRVYCVWSDGDPWRDGEHIFFSYTDDRAETWSDPVVLSEQRLSENETPEFSSFVPCIAVTNTGLVAVSWYDRRDLPPPTSTEPDASGIIHTTYDGWNTRLRVSLDGGLSWQPSVQVNQQQGVGSVHVGHTAGLTADADGRFHVTWIDNRTGENELWTTSVQIQVPLQDGDKAAIGSSPESRR